MLNEHLEKRHFGVVAAPPAGTTPARYATAGSGLMGSDSVGVTRH